MKLEDARKAYYEYSGKASELTRNLGFTAIALAWVFKSNENALKATVPKELFMGAKWAISSLVLDLLQYVVGALIWSAYARIKERQGTAATTDFRAPEELNYATIFCFWLKIAVMAYAYFRYVLPYLYGRV